MSITLLGLIKTLVNYRFLKYFAIVYIVIYPVLQFSYASLKYLFLYLYLSQNFHPLVLKYIIFMVTALHRKLLVCYKLKHCYDMNIIVGGRVMVFNATFNNSTVISWWSVLLVEEIGVPGENHRPVTSYWHFITS